MKNENRAVDVWIGCVVSRFKITFSLSIYPHFVLLIKIWNFIPPPFRFILQIFEFSWNFPYEKKGAMEMENNVDEDEEKFLLMGNGISVFVK